MAFGNVVIQFPSTLLWSFDRVTNRIFRTANGNYLLLLPSRTLPHIDLARMPTVLLPCLSCRSYVVIRGTLDIRVRPDHPHLKGDVCPFQIQDDACHPLACSKKYTFDRNLLSSSNLNQVSDVYNFLYGLCRLAIVAFTARDRLCFTVFNHENRSHVHFNFVQRMV